MPWVCAALTVLLAVLLAPIWIGRQKLKNGTLVGLDLRPLPNVLLRLGEGREATTDSGGKFHLTTAAPSRLNGYVLTQKQRRTGDGPVYTFVYSPTTDYVIECRTAPIEGLRGKIEITMRAVQNEVSFTTSIQEFPLRISDLPAGVPLSLIRIDASKDANFKVKRKRRSAATDVVKIDFEIERKSS